MIRRNVSGWECGGGSRLGGGRGGQHRREDAGQWYRRSTDSRNRWLDLRWNLSLGLGRSRSPWW